MMTLGKWLRLTGEHRLAFGRMWSVEQPRKKAKPHHPQRWRGGNAYNYGMEAPRYPVPATIADVSYAPHTVILWSSDHTNPAAVMIW